MKYSHSSKYRKTCPHDPETRAQLGFRLRYARLKLGWSIEDAGKYFQVTDRTWHNWETGAHRIPFAVYKLARVLARLELPDKAWAGWRLEGSVLITPEGRRITPQDGSWWSLLVRQAAGFRSTYAEANRLRMLLDKTTGAPTGGKASEAQLLPCAEGAGLVPYKTIRSSFDSNDVIMTSWPIPCDSPPPLTPLHAPKPVTWASPLTPSFALPWTPTCPVRVVLLRPDQGQHQSRPASSPVLKSKPSTNEKSGSEKSCSGLSSVSGGAV
nr:VC1465 family Xer recombination activation factor [Rhodoferax sp.]